MTPKAERTGGRLSARRRLLTVAAAVAAILIAVGTVAYFRFDPDYFERLAVSRFEQNFNLDVSLGSYAIKLWPSLGVELDDVSARRRGAPQAEPIVTIKAAKVYVQTIPLLWGRLVLSRIILDEPDLRVTRGPGGRLDVEELLAGRERKEKKGAGGLSGRLFVTRTRIRQGRLTITEKGADGKIRTTRVESLDLSMKDLAYGGEPEFELAAVMGEPSPGSRIRLEGRAGRLRRGQPFGEVPLDVKLAADRFDVKPFRPFLPEAWRRRVRSGVLTSNLSIEGSLRKDLAVKGDVRIDDADFGEKYAVRGRIDGKIDWRGEKGKTRGKAQLRLAPGAFVKGSMAIEGNTDVRADFETGEGGFDAKLQIDATGADYRQGDVFDKPAGTRLTLAGLLRKGKGGLTVRDAEGKIGDLPFSGAAEIGHAAGPGRSTPYALHFSLGEVALPVLQDYVPDLRAFDLGGKAVVSRLDILRRPEESREYQVTMDMRVSGAAATIPLEDGRAHTVRNLDADVAIVPGRLTTGESRCEINGAPITFKTDITEFMAMIAPAPDRRRAEIQLEAWGDDVDLDRLLEPAARATRQAAAAPRAGTAEAAPAAAAPEQAGGARAPEPSAPPGPGGTPAAPQPEAAPAPVAAAGESVAFLDRFFVTDGRLRAARAIYAKQPLTELDTRFTYHNPVLRLDETRFKAFEGDWRVDGTLALNGTTTFDLGVKVDHARVESIGRAFSEKETEPAIFGILDGRGELHGQGSDLPAWEKTLRGKGHITVRDGRLPGFNIFETVIRAVLGVFAKVIPVGKLAALSGENRFERFDQEFRIDRGRIWSDPIELTTADYLLTGKGSTGLDRTLDYRTTVELTPEGTQKMITLASLPILGGALQGIAPIPVRITGTVDEPKILPDASVISVGAVETLIRGVGGSAVSGAGEVVEGVGRILGVGKKEQKVRKGEEPGAAPPPEAPPAAPEQAEPPSKGGGEKQNPDLVDEGVKQLRKFLGR